MSTGSQLINRRNPAIVVVGFARPKALKRLLQSIKAADYEGFSDITLVISLDNSGNTEVAEIADSLMWEHGKKRIIKRPSRLGLKRHILDCGNMTEEFGSIIMLEDDLFVSPLFYRYTCAALSKIADHSEVAGVSLYSHKFNVFARLPFDAVDDGYDNYYFRFPSSWGQAWTHDQWKGFRNWLGDHDEEDTHGNGMPSFAADWGESSWLKYALKYAIETNKTWLYPRVSYTTNFFDEGEHSSGSVTDLQVPLSRGQKRDYCFSLPEQSGAMYDSYFENEALPYPSDIYGLKRRDKALPDKPFYSSEILPYEVKNSYALSLRPVDSNILFNIPGDGIFLYDPSNITGSKVKTRAVLEKYFYPGLNKKKIMKLIGDRFERHFK